MAVRGADRPYYPNPDLSITLALGDPGGDHAAYNGDSYLRYRFYDANSGGAVGGVVIVNANTDAARNYTVPFDAVDEQGSPVPAGAVITLGPNTGRILLKA